jgi:hypothetical protein
LVPKALALMSEASRPQVVHQSGVQQIEALRSNYTQAGVLAELTPFIEDTAQAFADADLIIGRAGASTVTEIAALGAAAMFVPFPAAVDDHQLVWASKPLSAMRPATWPRSTLWSLRPLCKLTIRKWWRPAKNAFRWCPAPSCWPN